MANKFTIVPMTLHIGAEIRGLDLSKPITPEIAESVNAALIKWKVIFFRGQNLSHAGQVSFARSMGEPTIGHAVFGHDPDYPEIYSVAKFRTAQTHRTAKMQRPWTGWHTDLTAAINPPKASILRGVTIPPYGGDTFWTNLAAAYEGLSETFRNFVDTLKGIHRFEPPAGAKINSNYDESIRRRVMESEHPIVRIHPESGERILFVSPSFLKSVSGLTPRESGQILELLWEHITRPEYTVRFKWEPGDIAMWDNRSTAHLAPTDIFESDYDRQLYRVTLVGDVPVGTDGEHSISLQGQPILSVQDELALQAAKGR
ncbi:MAG: TauD/TfdA family dioxygenase [Rhodospirillales bacterium]